MPTQHSIGKEVDQDQGIVVPLELDGLRGNPVPLIEHHFGPKLIAD
jgi:hypothetical protein